MAHDKIISGKNFSLVTYICICGILLMFMARAIFSAESFNKPSDADFSFARGIYLLAGKVNSKDLIGVINSRGVVGVSLTAEWKDIEPQESHYQWASLDEAIAKVTQMHKKVTLRMFPGISTPDWVYAKGAKAFEFVDKNPFHGEAFYRPGHRFSTYGTQLRMPIPWDEAFLASWEKFVEVYGSHYRNAANIAMVHVTGPTRHSAEMHLPKDREDQEKWRAVGYTPQKLIEAWKRSIDAFAKAFPETPLVLNLSPVIFEDGVMDEVVRYGYARYGRRLFLQNNILMAEHKRMKREDWNVLREYASKTTIGFQRGLLRLKERGDVAASERLRLKRANFEGMFAQGLALGAQYFEVGATDVKDFPDVVNAAAERLKK
jgi:Beta-galactosidase